MSEQPLDAADLDAGAAGQGEPSRRDRPSVFTGSRKIGPSPYWAIMLFVLHPLIWCGVLLIVFSHSAQFRSSLFELAFFPAAQRQLVAFYVWQKHLAVALWIWPLVAASLHVAVRLLTTSYELSDELLTIRYGLLGLGSPQGPFIQYADSIALSLITDVDARRNVFDLIVGTGTLVVSSHAAAAASGQVMLRHVRRSDEVRVALMSASNVSSTRVVVRA